VRALRDAEEAQYQALALRLSNAQANSAEANSLGSVAVIDRAEIAEPSLLGPNLLLALGLCVALALAIAAAYFAESLDPRFITPTDVESVYGRPVLGSLNSK
jgi:capsular polysaccharide biosynthesis protein